MARLEELMQVTMAEMVAMGPWRWWWLEVGQPRYRKAAGFDRALDGRDQGVRRQRVECGDQGGQGIEGQWANSGSGWGG